MHTPLVETRLAKTVGGNDVAALIAARNAVVPMGRMGDAWDVAHAVLFLASDEARYITGTEIIVDGGMHRRDAVIINADKGTRRMSEQRFKTLTPETMTPEQRAVAEAIQSGPRGAGLRGPFNALLRSPELCDLVQRVGAYVRFKSVAARDAERDGDLHGRAQMDRAVRVLRASPAGAGGWAGRGDPRRDRGRDAAGESVG